MGTISGCAKLYLEGGRVVGEYQAISGCAKLQLVKADLKIGVKWGQKSAGVPNFCLEKGESPGNFPKKGSWKGSICLTISGCAKL